MFFQFHNLPNSQPKNPKIMDNLLNMANVENLGTRGTVCEFVLAIKGMRNPRGVE
jgi:hypothetical protein